ncbi:hypothetical protein EYC84_005587 [Monilinia fructicola]|uniref:Uncharacterized protein n=1 Tax=Monilinia fructicola TaxID=38448 RepID=A0A5M9JX06_MONFR|nr:hypothetical protein EYC84_005587 [Monilinia fructicola]
MATFLICTAVSRIKSTTHQFGNGLRITFVFSDIGGSHCSILLPIHKPMHFNEVEGADERALRLRLSNCSHTDVHSQLKLLWSTYQSLNDTYVSVDILRQR